MSYDIQSDIRYELIQLLTHDSYNKSIAEYYQDEGDIYSSLDNMETEFDEIVCRLSISHPDKIARAASRLGSARCKQIIRESGRDRKSTRLNSSHERRSRMPSSA